jgi:hypothetical protein
MRGPREAVMGLVRRGYLSISEAYEKIVASQARAERLRFHDRRPCGTTRRPARRPSAGLGRFRTLCRDQSSRLVGRLPVCVVGSSLVCGRRRSNGSERAGSARRVGMLRWIEGVVASSLFPSSRQRCGYRVIDDWIDSEQRRDLQSNSIDPFASTPRISVKKSKRRRRTVRPPDLIR